MTSNLWPATHDVSRGVKTRRGLTAKGVALRLCSSLHIDCVAGASTISYRSRTSRWPRPHQPFKCVREAASDLPSSIQFWEASGLRHCFDAVLGVPTRKAHVLLNLRDRIAEAEVVGRHPAREVVREEAVIVRSIAVGHGVWGHGGYGGARRGHSRRATEALDLLVCKLVPPNAGKLP